ncbi:MAG: alpha/beta hydrolase [Gammaproteobacteria bacterium]|nr:alpha/beta fold hydrolase [Marinobacter nitratireducens]TNE78520.1 MAG: alpha/beta hydrolase [Gammaproteobacteria bacterium]TNE93969.1 MAG: alpha/beta hydrolase [Gammaproteobacteria bacterium]
MATALHVFLSHGLESGPGSTKIRAMKLAAESYPGVTAIALDHRSSKDPEVRLEQMHRAMEDAGAVPERTVLAGSSMGGWVCAQTSAQQRVLGCFLLAPALALPKYPQSSPVIQARFCQIIHGWDDDVVPVFPVLNLARDQSLPALVLPDGHRLENSLERVILEFRHFLEICLQN